MIMSPSEMKDALTKRRSSYEMFAALGYTVHEEHSDFIIFRHYQEWSVVKLITLYRDGITAYAYHDRFQEPAPLTLSVDELKAIAAWYKERGIKLC